MDSSPNLRDTSTRLYAWAAGVILHLVVFKQGEWDSATTQLLHTFVGTQVAATGYLACTAAPGTFKPLATVLDISALSSCLFFGILTSMAIYRCFFHRLNKFPGPFAARLSFIYPTMLSTRSKLHLYKEVQRLHEKYGDIVRLGMQPRSLGPLTTDLTFRISRIVHHRP